MLTIRDPADLGQVADPFLQVLIAERLADMAQGEDFDPEVHGYVLVLEPGDPLAEVEAAFGAPLLANPVTHLTFGQPGFRPVFEYVGAHPGWFEVVAVPGDGDFGVVLFVPDLPGIDPRLLALCAVHSAAESRAV